MRYLPAWMVLVGSFGFGVIAALVVIGMCIVLVNWRYERSKRRANR